MGTESLEAVLVDEQDVDYDGAEAVRASVHIGSGQVHVAGGAEQLMHARFEYSHPDWKPEVEYHITEGIGHLEVRQPNLMGTLTMGPKYAWGLTFGDGAPIDLGVRLGSGSADLDLDGTSIASLDATVGSGRIGVSATQGSAHLASISLKAGSGQATVSLDGTYDNLERIDLSSASGVNELHLHGIYPHLRHLRVRSASGRTVLELGGNLAALESAAVNAASGNVVVELADVVGHDVNLTINCVSGTATVRYAAGMGVSARFSSVSGRVEAPGFRKSEGKYVNGAYETAETRADLVMSTVSGKLILQPAE